MLPASANGASFVKETDVHTFVNLDLAQRWAGLLRDPFSFLAEKIKGKGRSWYSTTDGIHSLRI